MTVSATPRRLLLSLRAVFLITVFFLLLLVLVSYLPLASHLHAQSLPSADGGATSAETNTVVNAHILTDTVWTLAGSPYQVTTDIQVFPEATLTVEPGVVVQFAQQTMLDVRGKILATGTHSQTILFTGSTPQPGWWDGIHVSGATDAPNIGSVFDYVTIEYGGYLYANLYLHWAEAKVDHSIMRYSLKDGLYGVASTGIDASNLTLTNNGRYPVYIYEASGQGRLENLVATGNSADAIVLRTGIVLGERRFENAGLPYHIMEYFGVNPGGVLSIDPGVEVAFNTNVSLDMRGILHAVGTAADPILLTGIKKIRGDWNGIFIQGLGTAPNHGSVLDHVTLEYGGRVDANLRIQQASARITNSTIRQSLGDGILVNIGATATWIEKSAIVDNTGFGVRNNSLEGRAVIAAGNWWGAPTGPTVAQNCNEGGTGSLVSANVEFMPFITEAGEQPSPVAPLDLHQIAISPQRWYIPADGVTQAEVILTLRTGEGNPIAGQQVFLHTTLGQIVSGGVTDGHGQTRARIKSLVAGEAVLTASVTRNLPCSSNYRSGTSTIRFTPYQQGDVPSDAAAPYADGRLDFSPMPIITGVTTRLGASLVNTNTFPIYINGTFGVVQSGIGLAFPPVGSVEDFVIPAKSTRTVAVNWVPPIAGHYCIRFDYNWTTTPAGVDAALVDAPHAPGSMQRNLDSRGSSPTNSSDKQILDKTQKSLDAVNTLTSFDSDPTDIDLPGRMVDAMLGMMLDTARSISQALGFDPPRQDFTIIAIAEPIEVPHVTAGPGISAGMATAMNAMRDALALANAHGEAAIISWDRYGGATAAYDMTWASQQIQAHNDNKAAYAQQMLLAADALEAYLAARTAAGLPDIVFTLDVVIANQERLREDGFTQTEIDAAHLLGYSDAEIEARRQSIINRDPLDFEGSSSQRINELIEYMRELGRALLFPPTFGGRVGGSAGLLLAAGIEPPPDVPITNNLARVFEVTSTLQIANPETITATIDLRIVPVDLPAGWTAAVVPQQLILGAGAQTEVQVRITPLGPAVQGTSTRVAVEGYIGSELLGGVLVETLVPYNVSKPDAHLTTFLPVVGK